MMAPLRGNRKPLMTLNSVVLPEPFGPIRPIMPLSGTGKVTLRSTARPPKLCPTSSSRRISVTAWLFGMVDTLGFGQLGRDEAECAGKAAGQENDDTNQRKPEQDLMEVAETAQ